MKIEMLSITPNAEALIERCARVCYQSESNDSQTGGLISKLIKSGHHSVLEHASATFLVSEVSRALTHQLVRHRLCAFSQQSQRYVKEDQFDYVIPTSISELIVKHPERLEEKKGVNPYVEDYKKDMQYIQYLYNKWKALGVKNEDARFVLPNACHTEIAVTANFREWRHIFDVRCDKHAQWEIRKMAGWILLYMYQNAPSVFEDQREKFNDLLRECVSYQLA